eukprot:TRINITY_DN5801_c0_g2_i1.p1 TRINITY_DN5801_c0_g2~~TRINITY_DN5801_c0_g2_i1.p1  ORF type:complete len:430 (+),score=56.80 TRINITY_DN5801_c0_g2_i1:60-1292(+)
MASFILVVLVCASVARVDNHRLLKEQELSWHTPEPPEPPAPPKPHCEKTAYEEMVEANQVKPEHVTIGVTTAVLVIDAQRGFTANKDVDDGEGGFHQQCIAAQEGKSDKSIEQIVNVINAVKAEKGFVVATKDYHPADHCSFYEHCVCKNQDTAATYAGTDEADAYTKNRFWNDFPPHCVGMKEGEVTNDKEPADWKTKEDAKFVPIMPTDREPRQSETQLHHDIAAAMKDYDRSFIAYKGFDRDYESFGAFPMQGEKENAKRSVGAKIWLENGKEVVFNDEKNPKSEVFENYVKETENSEASFKPLEEFLKERKIEQLLVVGYVYDYCVKETAIGAMQSKLFKTVTVFLDACRPAADGNCNDNTCNFGFLIDSGRDPRSKVVLGSRALADITFKQLKKNNVKQAKWSAQ